MRLHVEPFAHIYEGEIMSQERPEGISAESEMEDRYENYAILSRLFREELDVSLLGDLKDSPTAEPVGNQDFDEGYATIRAYLDGVADMAASKSQLAIDYCLVFVGYGISPDAKDDDAHMNAAYPYESVYTTGSKTLTTGLTEGVTALYRGSGFQPQRPRILADDHMACELEFMQFLVGLELMAHREGRLDDIEGFRRIELDFLDAHPRAWIDQFSSAIQKISETTFYPALARMTKGWLQEDASYLKGVLRDE